MKKLITATICIIFSGCVCAQTSNDITDSLANDLKQYTITIDVGNGNIYLPVKKKNKEQPKKMNFTKRSPFIQPDKYQTLYKQEVIDNKVINIPIGTYKLSKDNESKIVKYLIEGRYLKPTVGSFIKLEFINVPRDVEVGASVDFQDKNQEGAAAFNNVLSKYQGAFDKAVEKDTARMNAEIKKVDTAISKAIEKNEEKLNELQTNLNNTLSDIETVVSKIADVNEKLIDKNPKNKDPNHKILVAKEIKDDIAKILNDTTLINKLNDESKAKVNVVKNKLTDIEDFLNAASGLILGNKSDINKVRKSLEESKELVTKIKADISIQYNKLKDSLLNIIKLRDSSYKSLYDSIYKNRTIKIIPFQVANTDLSIINLQFTRKGQVYAEREILLKNKFGFKLDFSTGFVGTTLRDDNYRLYSRSGDSSAIINDPKGKFTVGFGFMAHAYFRTGNRINVALTSGFALNGSNQTINYILGAAIPLGLEQRFIISAGVLFGKVKTLSSGYKVSDNVDSLASTSPSAYLNNNWYKNIQNTGVPLTEKWSNGFYFGITYNLGTLIGNQQKKSFKVN
jgi:hypothetical protein